MILLAVILMDLLAGMEFDLFVPSFPALQHYFSLTAFEIEALLSANFIGYCLSLFFVGGLADRYGRKSIILSGLGIFTLGSILCLWAGSYHFLLIGRFFQGVGIAAPAILSFLIIADAYTLKKQQRLLAMLNGLMNISVGFAPVVGSYITLYFHWQGNFIMLLLLGLFTLIMTACFIPFKLPEKIEPSNFKGYSSLFQSKSLMLLILHIIAMCIPYWLFVGMSPLLYMKNLGVSLTHFGYYQGLFALVFALGSLGFGFIMHRFNQKKMLYLSMQIFMLSLITVGLTALFNSTYPLLITLALLPFIIGQIAPSTILYPLALNLMPEAKGKISALIQGGRLLFTALSLQLAGYFYDGSFRSIGLILSVFILMSIVTLYAIIRHRDFILL